jgi:NADPH-dependent glutamate synthase beta subunit-like oxidoreductase/Pyruvate/2-oxoacid:ferredoxin oxidoreductase delta subunit
MAAKKIAADWIGRPNRFPAISTGSSRLELTGSWRFLRPSYRNLFPPCNQGCPAGNDVRGFIEFALKEQWQEAFQLILRTSPFPSVCGRVCYHPCETVCNRVKFDEPLAIHSIERYIGDVAGATMLPLPTKKSGRRVAVIGSGPAGLSCAYQLVQMGIEVVVFESMPHPGGMLYYGIPPYRLPKDVLLAEVRRIEHLGVRIELNSKIGSTEMADLQKKFDAVFVAVGAHGEQNLGVDGENLEGVKSGLHFLKKINAGEPVKAKPRIMVVGGGNTAMDVARSAKRQGSQVLVLYRRTRAEMPAHPDEVKETLDEGIEIQFLAAPKRIIGQAGRLTAVECQKMMLGKPDSSGRRRPVPIEGETFTLEVDEVYTAIGERPELDPFVNLLEMKWDRVQRDRNGRTSLPAVFCGGDAGTDAAGTVVNAIGEGRRAAYAIESYFLDKLTRFTDMSGASVSYEMLNLDHFSAASRVASPHESLSNRSDFREVVHNLEGQAVVKEAGRCFSCGVCNYCLNCHTFCPDSAVIWRNKTLEIDYRYCKGCGICVTECPRNAMCLEEER